MTAVTIRNADLLAGALRGDVITPDHHRYDEARKVWNGDIDRRPPLIARCADAADVATVVRFAAERGLPIAVRGGGHSVAGHALCEDGVVVDLSAMRAVRVDPARGLAHVQGGALWQDVDRETQLHGRAVTGGIFVDLDAASPHGEANRRIFEGLTAWMRAHTPNVAGLAQFDKLTDVQMKEAFRSMDPLAK